MHSQPFRESEARPTDGSLGPQLKLLGGLRRFLAPRRTRAGAFRQGEPRFERVVEVVRTEVSFTNGLGKSTPATHLAWFAASANRANGWQAGEFFTQN